MRLTLRSGPHRVRNPMLTGTKTTAFARPDPGSLCHHLTILPARVFWCLSPHRHTKRSCRSCEICIETCAERAPDPDRNRLRPVTTSRSDRCALEAEMVAPQAFPSAGSLFSSLHALTSGHMSVACEAAHRVPRGIFA